MREMSEKQKLFCNEYLIDLNGTRAYKVAYPNTKKDSTARVCASNLLTKPNIKEYIAERLDEIKNSKIADAQEVIEYLTSVIRGQETEQLVSKGGAIMKIQVTPKDRLRAAELLGKRYGIYTENINTTINTSDKFSDVLLQLKNNKTLE